MTQTVKTNKRGQPRVRSTSGTLGPREELLRESIRNQVASKPYIFWTQERTRLEAEQLAFSLHKSPELVRKAIYNRRQFVNRKIEKALVKFEVLDTNSSKINDIAELVDTIAINVIHYLDSHREKINAEINAKHKANA